MLKKCTPVWREAHFQVNMYKTHQHRTTFGSWDVEKVHAGVARSTFPSKHVQNTPFSDHFWKLRCRKSAHRCGAKHISKSKCTKHTNAGPLLTVEMFHQCTRFWGEAHFQVKSVKKRDSDYFLTFRCRKSVHRGRAKHISKSKVSKTVGLGHFWTVRCRFSWHAQGILDFMKSEQTWRLFSSFNYNHQCTTLH